MEYKIINDTIHGGIKVEGLFLELIETAEFQRLHNIKQLGLTHLVFPGANHSRLEHSLGTFYIAERIATELGLEQDEKKLVCTTALLHDLGHGPFSHTLEYIHHSVTGIEHMEITRNIILGEYSIIQRGELRILKSKKSIPDILEKHDIDPKTVSALVTSDVREQNSSLDSFSVDVKKRSKLKNYLCQIVHGIIDADQLDYLLRDSHYTGVAHGIIDIDRILRTMEIYNDELVVNKRGVNAVEGMLVARDLMYSSVYFHKVVRISELMLARAVERLPGEILCQLPKFVDSELIELLKKGKGFQREVVSRLKYRRLYKKVYSLGVEEADEERAKTLLRLCNQDERRKKEDEICRRAGIPDGSAIIDIPRKELLVSEPRLGRTEVKIKDENKLRPLSRYSPLARALKSRHVPDWTVMVSAHPSYRGDVRRVVERVLFS